jgi:F0F1-type ATP synthase membrane subunit b/b'
MSLFDPAQLWKDISDVAGPVITKARTDAETEVANAVAAARGDVDKLKADAQADARAILGKLRQDVGAAAEVARADLFAAVKNADPAVQQAVQDALRGSFNRLLELLAASVL